MAFFKCKHPFWALAVEKEHTSEKQDADFIYVDYHLWCQECNTPITLKWAQMIGGVGGFMSRGKNE